MIPRPSGARPGCPAPWSHLSAAERSPSLSDVAAALADRGPGRLVGAAPADAGESAVLIVLYEHAGRVHVVLTRRSAHLRHHAHEVSFPGGRRDAVDLDLWHTALREATEEVDIDPGSVRRVGELDNFMTVGSRTLVHPFVVVTDRCPHLTAAPDEVESIIHVSLDELLLDEVWREELWLIPALGEVRAVTFFELVGDTVWGATASMLRQLLAIVTGVDDQIRGGPA